MPYFIVNQRYEYGIRYYTIQISYKSHTNLIKFLCNLEFYFLFKIKTLIHSIELYYDYNVIVTIIYNIYVYNIYDYI